MVYKWDPLRGRVSVSRLECGLGERRLKRIRMEVEVTVTRAI